MNTIKLEGRGNVRMIAHRGLSGLEKENTCSAFVAAANREGYFGIETDVHCTADGHFVIFHDDNTRRVGLDALTIEESSFETLRALQLTDMDGKRGRSDLRIPTLEEYIGICRKYEKISVLELKNLFHAADIYKIAAVIILRRRFPGVAAQYLLDDFKPADLDTLRQHNLGLDIRYTALNREIVEAVHGIGEEVNCWTVNTPEDGQAMIDLGVDYITTNILE